VKHGPARGSWANDAADLWRALDGLGCQALPPAPSPKSASKARARKSKEEASLPSLEADWPLLPLVRGKMAVIFGGEPRGPNRERLEAYLQLDTLDWPDTDGPRKVEAVAQRIGKGGYDLVIVLQQLVTHPNAARIIQAARDSKTPWAMVESYGATAVRAGLERFLRPAAAE
jgi:hypothetical protein